jgi:hypothetical protein
MPQNFSLMRFMILYQKLQTHAEGMLFAVIPNGNF